MTNSTLNITEIFSSIQGESSYVGIPTSFIRLSGCNLSCKWCDALYAHTPGTTLSVLDIIDKITPFQNKYACITGGEPLTQENVYILIDKLLKQNYTISIETNGSVNIAKVPDTVKAVIDLKCPASGMDHLTCWENLDKLRPCDEIKFVICNKSDYQYAKDVIKKYDLSNKGPNVLLSPAHGILNPQELSSWILDDHLSTRLNIQVHKYIWPAETHGV